MKIITKLTEMLGIDLPVIGAPMFLVSYPDLVVAVSEAGGIGCFPSMNYRDLGEFRGALEEIRGRTKKPVGVNIVLYKDHNPQWARQVEIALEFGIELIITSMGAPRSVVRDAKASGSKVFCDVISLRHAEIVAAAGADGLIAVTDGAGGHTGNISPFSLIPYLIQEVGLPVVAAGSIGTGQQMAAALSLGAVGVSVGTRFIATPESGAKEEYKQMILQARPEDIVKSAEISGVPANWIRQSIEGLVSGAEVVEPFRRWRDIWSAGHGVAQIHEIRPVAEIMEEMVREYEATRIALPAVE